jgi:glycosyltransferase involved in cell wall biosynthesis
MMADDHSLNYSNSTFNIVTVARLAEEKSIDRALRAIKYCIDKGHDITYHVVGSGGMEAKLKEEAISLGLGDRVVFYGEQSNPYRYIKNADLFMLTSYHEAAPMVFDESACLGVPVLATATTSTDEMITEAGAGFVCENTQEGINEKLLYLLNNRDELEKVRLNLKKKSFNNEEIVKKFKEIIEL